MERAAPARVPRAATGCSVIHFSHVHPANIASIQERISAAARRAGRNPEDITLMAVSKTQPPERIREAYEAGLRLFGENRVQEFASQSGRASGSCATPNGT